RDGVRALLIGRLWRLPVPERAFLERMGRDPKTFLLKWRWESKEETAIVLGIASLLRGYGDRLRTCKTCGGPFLAVKRQEYCTTLCSQRMRDARKKEAR